MKKILYTLLLSIMLFYGCVLDRIERREVKIINKSKDTIYCLISYTNSIDNRYVKYDNYRLDRRFVDIDSSANVYDKPRDWDTYISNSDDSKMRLFIISKDSINKYGFEEVVNKNIYTKVYKLDIEDLNKMNWTVTYEGK